MDEKYPDSLNPFDDNEQKEDADSLNPFKDEEESQDPGNPPAFVSSSSHLFPDNEYGQEGERNTPVCESRSHFQSDSTPSSSHPLPGSAVIETSPSPSQKSRRPAPTPPVVRAKLAHESRTPDSEIQDSTSKSPAQAGKKKRLAPAPPQRPSSYIKVTKDTVNPTPEILVSEAETLRLDSPENGVSSQAAADSNRDDQLSEKSDGEEAEIIAADPTNEVLGELLEKWRLLHKERQEIETELRVLMSLDSESRTAEFQLKEKQLLEALVDNVKRKQDLEEQLEADEDSERASVGSSAPSLDAFSPTGKKMKKKRKFKLKKLFGVKT